MPVYGTCFMTVVVTVWVSEGMFVVYRSLLKTLCKEKKIMNLAKTNK